MKFFIFNLLSIISLQSFSDVAPTCSQVTTSRTWNYCFSSGKGKNAQTVVFHFHGGGLSEKSWFDSNSYSEQIRQYLKNENIDSPTIVTISFGPMWLLAPQSSLPKSGLYEILKNEVMPYIEKNVLNNKIQQRIIIGESMGGFNAGTYALQNIDLFSKVILLCPALGLESTKENKHLANYVTTTGAELPYAKFIFQTRDDYFLSPQTENDYAPLELIKKINSNYNTSKFYLSCGDKDQYGFYFGADEFVKIASDNRIDVSWYPVKDSGHCSVDVDSLSKFILTE